MHFPSILSGSLLWTSWKQIIISLVVFSSVGVCFYLIRKPIEEISNGYQKGAVKNLKVVFWDFIFYVLFGVVITLSVQAGGIVVVFAYLIIPATISVTLTSRLGLQITVIWISALLTSLRGLLFAYYLDFSIVPAIAMFLGCELVIRFTCSKVLARNLEVTKQTGRVNLQLPLHFATIYAILFIIENAK